MDMQSVRLLGLTLTEFCNICSKYSSVPNII